MQTQKLLDRIATLLQVNLSDLALDEADPQAAVAHWRAEMERGLEQAKDAVAAARVQERRLEQQLKEAQISIARWDAQVDAALQARDEEQALVALRRKMAYESVAQELQLKLDHHRQVVAEMKASVKALQDKIQDLEGLARPPRSGSKTL